MTMHPTSAGIRLAVRARRVYGLAMSNSTGPDAALISAWHGYRAAYKALSALPEAASAEDEQVIHDLMTPLEDLLVDTPAMTLEGLLRKMKFALAVTDIGQGFDAHPMVFDEIEMPAEKLAEHWWLKMAWNNIQNVRDLIRQHQAVNDAPTVPTPFTAAADTYRDTCQRPRPGESDDDYGNRLGADEARVLSLPLQTKHDAATLLRLVRDESLTDKGDQAAYEKLLGFLGT